MTSIHAESDDRVRANLVESLWTRREPEVEQVLQRSLRDPHHRVVANAIYGLDLMDSNAWVAGLDRLLRSRDPIARRSGTWVIKSVGGATAVARLKPLIRDLDPSVRSAAFAALVFLRESAEKRATPAPRPEEPAPAGTVIEPAVIETAVIEETLAADSEPETAEAQIAAEVPDPVSPSI
jgi:hypothetical protein